MLDFRDIAVADKEAVTRALAASGFLGCEYSFANNMAWRRLSGSKISFYKDFYICCAFDTEDGHPHFIFPAGNGNIREVIGEMKRTSESLGSPLVLTSVTDRVMPVLEELYPNAFTAHLDRDSCDYIYNASDLIELRGKKYHGKRNHLARFLEQEYEYLPITEKYYDDCIVFCTDVYNRRTGSDDHSYVAEQFAINTYFSHFEELGLQGGMIRVGGRTAAVTIGEKHGRNDFCVHIEKADTSVPGIYAGINNLFAKAAASDSNYINREEDLGLEGLRRAKLSYHPAFLLNKYTVTFK